MLGFQIDPKQGILVFPAIIVGYSITNCVLHFFSLGISTKWDIHVIDYQLSVIWKIGKTLTDQ